MGIPSADELLNRDIAAMLKDKVPQSTDISKISIGSAVSSDKLIQSVGDSPTTSNVFGVFDIKQIVKELSGDLESPFSREFIDSLDPWKLANIAMKLGKQIFTDLDFEDALNAILSKLSFFKQLSFGSFDDFFDSLVDIVAKDPTLFGGSLLQSLNLDDDLLGFLPSNMPVNDFETMKGLFNGVNGAPGLNSFNSCDNLTGLLGWSKKLTDPNALYASLFGLFDLLGKNDMGGVLNCIDESYSSLDVQQTARLRQRLIDNGSIYSMYDMSTSGSNASILNKYRTARELGSNLNPVYDPFTLRQGRIYETPGPITYTAALFFAHMGIDKKSIFSSNVMNDTNNRSILDRIDDNVYDRTSIVNAPTNNKFTDFCFDSDGTDRLLRSIPDSFLS